MDFSALIKKSFGIAWHNRVLWLFGFLAGGAGGAGSFNPSGFSVQLPNSLEKHSDSASKVLGINDSVTGAPSPQTILLIILVITLVILILILIAIFVSNWAAAALVYSIIQRNKARPSFGAGASAGLKYWWKFWLLAALLGLLVLVFFLMLALPVAFLFFSGLKPLAIAFLIIAALIFLISLFVIGVVGSLIISIAQRMIIHRGVGVIESVRLSGGLIKKYLGESVLTYLVAVGLNIAAGFVAFIAILPIILVLGLVFVIAMVTGGVWAGVAAAILAGIPALILLFAAGGFWNAFQAAYWTLFYEHLAAKEGW